MKKTINELIRSSHQLVDYIITSAMQHMCYASKHSLNDYFELDEGADEGDPCKDAPLGIGLKRLEMKPTAPPPLAAGDSTGVALSLKAGNV